MLGCDRFGEVRMGWTKWEYSGLSIFKSKEVKKTITFYSDLWMKNIKIFIDLIIIKLKYQVGCDVFERVSIKF
jgi:hypothetical protein